MTQNYLKIPDRLSLHKSEKDIEIGPGWKQAGRRRAGSGPCAAQVKQRVAPVLAGANAGRDGEDGAAGVVDVLVQGVARQRLLELDELVRALHEGDEEKAAEQGPGLRVDAVGEGVAAAQDPGPAVVLETGQPYVGVDGDGGLPVGASLGEVGRAEFRS